MGDAGAGRARDDMAALYRVPLLRLRGRRLPGFRRTPELERALSLEHHERLLVCGVAVRRSAFLVRGQRDAVEPTLFGSAGVAETLRQAAVVALDLVERDDVLGPLAWAAV